MVVPCVNYYDNTMPPPCTYSAKRVPNEGVNLNLDTNFMCGCDCEDDCMVANNWECFVINEFIFLVNVFRTKRNANVGS